MIALLSKGLQLVIFVAGFLTVGLLPIQRSANELHAQEKPSVTVSASPNRSRRGETVRFKISVRSGESGGFVAPRLDNLEDWDIVNTFRSESPRVTMINGRVEYQYQAEITYFLRPLKVGELKIPSLQVQVAGTDFQTEPLTIPVDSLGNGQQSRARRNTRPSPGRPQIPGLSGRPQLGQQTPGNSGSSRLDPSEIPERESFFIRGELSKKEVWEGELIELDYVLYQRTRSLRDFEMVKFPDFKGFIKEELFISKNFSQNRVRINNEDFLRSEVIRYALFPLKSGQLKIDPFQVKATIQTRPEDLIESLMTGRMPPQMGAGIPTAKSSGPINVTVKPLPPTPVGANFSGAVGQFEVDMKAPDRGLAVDQPFTVQFTIGGKGNVKLIEAPTLPLPDSLELYQTTNTAELRKDATGYKNFEFLLLPRKNGAIEIPSFEWAYFDPDKGQYEVIQTPVLKFNVEGSAPTIAESGNQPVAAPKSISPFETSYESLNQDLPYNSLIQSWSWPLVGTLFAFLVAAFAIRKKEESLESHLKNNPWKKTQGKIEDKEYKGSIGLAILVDQWIREFLAGNLKDETLHGESVRSEFFKSLRSRLPQQHWQESKKLDKLFTDLDLIRFSGSKKLPANLQTENLFQRAESLCEALIKQCRFDKPEPSVVDDEEDD